MKNQLTLLASVAASLTTTALMADTPPLLASPTSFVATSSTNDAAPLLQLAVTVPASMYPMFEDDVASAFADRVSNALKAQGFKGRLVYVSQDDHPASDQPLLTVNLFEWRYDRIGTVECTFTTKLVTPKGNNELGLFTGMSPFATLSRHDPFGRADQFDDAANQAMSGLLNRINQTHLIN